MSFPLRSRRAFLRDFAIASATLATGCASRATPPGEASLWYSYGGTNREVLLSLVDAFHARQSRHRIHATYQGDYFEGLAKVRTAIAAGAPPTLTHVVNEVVPYLEEANVLTPLDACEGAADLKADLVSAIAQSSYVTGDERPLVALPFNRSTPIAYLNGDLLRTRGLAIPKTWEELRAFAKAATKRESEATSTWGFECPIDWWFWVALVAQAGGEVVAPDGTPTLGGAEGEKALSFWRTLVREDQTMRPPPGRDYNAWEATNADFLAGHVAMIWTSTAFLRYIEKNAKFPVVAAPLPRDAKQAVPTGGTMFVMPKGPPPAEQDAAWAFLRFMAEPAQANAWATRTGYLPTSKRGLADLENAGYYREHPNDRVAVDQLAFATKWPWSPRLFRIQREVVQPRLEEAILGDRPVEEMLGAARLEALEPG